jgi:mannose-6-phosphate isomerase-like protein (cupin superfamily)
VKTPELKSLRRRWGARGFTVNRQVDPPGKRWPVHRHAVDEIVMLGEGRLKILKGSHVLPGRSGKEVVIPRQMPHALENPGPGKSQYFYGFRNKKRQASSA